MTGSLRIRFVFQKHSVTEHPCPNHNSSQEDVCSRAIRFLRAFGYQSIHGQAMISFVFQEHRVTRASMPNHDLVYVSKSIRLPFRSYSKSIGLPEHPCQPEHSVTISFVCSKSIQSPDLHDSVVFVYQNIHVQTIIPLQEDVSRAHDEQSVYAEARSHSCSNANGFQSIHAKPQFGSQEHSVTRASMPKPQFRSCSKSIGLPEHPCQTMIWFMFFVCVPRAYGCQSIHAQTIIPLCSKSIRLPEHPCPNHNSSPRGRVSRAHD